MTRKKKITLGSLGLLLVGLAVLSYVRWNVWFGNPPEAPYAPQPTPSRVLLTFGNDGALLRNVSWQRDFTIIHQLKMSSFSERDARFLNTNL